VLITADEVTHSVSESARAVCQHGIHVPCAVWSFYYGVERGVLSNGSIFRSTHAWASVMVG
jgi:hypothetical protein